jgi:catechol 2,3-dioxygenase-like lactoylglutathione lyase family enzyme
MELGTFSVSLNVEDLAASQNFYAALGFVPLVGDGETWMLMGNGPHVIGLFEDLLEENLMTFNPGWAAPGVPADRYTDVRELSRRFREVGIETLVDNTGDTPAGPASFTVIDPDGNVIMFDQHV